MLPIVQRSLPLAHQFDFATPPDAGYGEFGARDSQACFGTKRTCQLRSAMFAFGNKVDIDRAMQSVRALPDDRDRNQVRCRTVVE
jgi:hypothetical protein